MALGSAPPTLGYSEFSGGAALTPRGRRAHSVGRMTTPHRTIVAGLAAGACVLSLAACSSSKSSSTRPTSTTSKSSTSSSTDRSNLLIAASDIPVPGFTRGVPSATPQGDGTTVNFTDSGGTRILGDTIIVFPSASAAASAAQASATAAKGSVTGGAVSTPQVGSNSTLVSGTSGSGAATLLVFTEGRAEVVLEFTSPANDPVPASVVEQVGTKQDAAVKNGLS